MRHYTYTIPGPSYVDKDEESKAKDTDVIDNTLPSCTASGMSDKFQFYFSRNDLMRADIV